MFSTRLDTHRRREEERRRFSKAPSASSKAEVSYSSGRLSALNSGSIDRGGETPRQHIVSTISSSHKQCQIKKKKKHIYILYTLVQKERKNP